MLWKPEMPSSGGGCLVRDGAPHPRTHTSRSWGLHSQACQRMLPFAGQGMD